MRAKIKLLAAAVSLAATPAVFAASPLCAGAVRIGDGTAAIVTMVADRAIGDVCLDDLIVDTAAEGARYANHGEFVAEVTRLVAGWRSRDLIDPREAAELTNAAARSQVGKTTTVRVIAFNDFHGNIDGAGQTLRSDADDLFVPTPTGARGGVPAGGADFLAGLVRQLRQGAPYSVVVSAGDLIGASPLNSALFHDEPTIESMNRVGLDFNAVGNHEFDEGKDELLRMQNGGCHPTDPNSCQGDKVGTPYPFEGAAFEFLAANVADDATGTTVFPPYGIREYGGIRVAFIGVTLRATPSIVAPSGIVGLEFGDEAETVNALVAELQRERVEAIVVLVHEGGFAPGSINGCSGVAGPIVDIVARLDDAVDLVVSGHTHQAYNCRLPNAAARAIPVTSAGSFGRLVTSIDLTLDTGSRDVVAAHVENRLVDRTNFLGAEEPIVPSAEVGALIAGYNALSGPIAGRVIGTITADITRATNAAGESPLGDVIADAQLLATSATARGSAVAAFMNSGGIRADFTHSASGGEGDGRVTYGEAFTVQPFGNSLVVKTLTGQQLYDLLNQQWAAGQPSGGRILQVSEGFSYRHRFTPNASPLGGEYVCDGSVAVNGVPIDKGASYRVTMNSFLATGGDNFGVFNLGRDPLGGELDLDALEAYFAEHGSISPGLLDRIQRVTSCD